MGNPPHPDHLSVTCVFQSKLQCLGEDCDATFPKSKQFTIISSPSSTQGYMSQAIAIGWKLIGIFRTLDDNILVNCLINLAFIWWFDTFCSLCQNLPDKFHATIFAVTSTWSKGIVHCQCISHSFEKLFFCSVTVGSLALSPETTCLDRLPMSGMP